MQVFVQVNLENPAASAYHKPVLAWLKAHNPSVAFLDLDSFSDEMLATQATRLLQAATRYVVYFKVAEPEALPGTAFTLLEEILRAEKPGLILLEGTHTRFKAIVQSRAFLKLIAVNNPTEIAPLLQKYFNPAQAPD